MLVPVDETEERCAPPTDGSLERTAADDEDEATGSPSLDFLQDLAHASDLAPDAVALQLAGDGVLPADRAAPCRAPPGN